MSCRHFQELASARLDGALAPEEAVALAEHLSACETCSRHALALERTRTALRTLPARVPVPDAILARVEAASLRIPQRRRWRAFAVAAVMSVAALVTAAGALRLRDPSSRHLPDLCTILVEDHIRYLGVDGAVDVSASDAAEVERWFAERLDFAVRVPHLPAARLLGGRLCFLEGRRVALLFFDHPGGRVSLFVLPNTALGGLERRADGTWGGGMHGYHVRAVRSDGNTYAVVSDLPERELATLLPEDSRGDRAP